MNVTQMIEALEDAGYSVRSYSGRAMYGRQCVGVEVEQGVSTFTLGVHLALALGDDADELADLSVRTDSLGLDQIIYFPDLKWPEGRKDSDDEEDSDDDDEDEDSDD